MGLAGESRDLSLAGSGFMHEMKRGKMRNWLAEKTLGCSSRMAWRESGNGKGGEGLVIESLRGRLARLLFYSCSSTVRSPE